MVVTKDTDDLQPPFPCNEDGLPPPDPMDADRIAAISKAIGHPARVEILHHFECRTPTMVRDLVAEGTLAQSTVSEHLRILREADLLFVRDDGPRSWYCMRRSVLEAYVEAVSALAAADTRADG